MNIFYFCGLGDNPKTPSKSHTKVPSNHQTKGKILDSPNLKNFCFSELKEATKNFSPGNVLGKGGFGCVFKGWIDENSLNAVMPETGMTIAVKVLDQTGCQGQQEWLAEIKYLGQLYHPNVVKLIGYCLEDGHRLLVYEFMPNGSLDKHLIRLNLFEAEDSYYIQPLSWNLRMKVALGAAKGLAFLHDEAQVIYRDFKASNILLDSALRFGLAKDGPTDDKSHLTASILGTNGYFLSHLTTKSDVYSFGVVLLELVSGRPAIDEYRTSTEQNLVEWARPYLSSKRKIFQVFDPCLEGKYALSGALKAAKLAVQCLSTELIMRPSMKEVVKELEQIALGKH
ncbi:hypothetical protein GH714_035225 [Hevea brasiliensis]|uniref:non-specific serine/threonine protein kinase n=1 Tax=Hevea brasiliensis TaxID=3981 RepID=A0A6A6L4M2_HEVBR|nr:hypothetical protein GH714_035225 [Hevea brasiliensis]